MKKSVKIYPPFHVMEARPKDWKERDYRWDGEKWNRLNPNDGYLWETSDRRFNE